jgi:hypothetical protein
MWDEKKQKKKKTHGFSLPSLPADATRKAALPIVILFMATREDLF